MQHFIIRWRVWLTNRLTADWLDRPRLLPRALHRPDHRQPRPAHPARHRRLHHGDRPGNQHADRRDVHHAAVRRRQFDRVGGVIRPDPVESVRPVDDSRLHDPQGTVLDGMALRVLRDGRRVLDRPPADPAELPQRGDQRRIPLRPGPIARRRRGGRFLPRRTRRAQDARYALRRRSSTTTGRSSDAASLSSAGTKR